MDDGRNTTISAKIAEDIKEQISDGRLRPGDRLPAERELALELGVARAPVREALRELRAQGYVESGKGRQRSVVASLGGPGIHDPLAHLLRAGTGHYRDLIELRQGLEVQAAGLAAERRGPEDLESLAAIVGAMEAFERGRDKRGAELDAAFHGTLANATHNVFYMHVTAELVRLLHENIPGILEILHEDPDSSAVLLRQHRAIATAIEQGNAKEARAAVSDHLEYVLDGLSRIDPTAGARAPATLPRPVLEGSRFQRGLQVLDRDLVD